MLVWLPSFRGDELAKTFTEAAAPFYQSDSLQQFSVIGIHTLLYQYFSVPSTSHSYRGLPCHTLTTRTFVNQTNLCSVLGGFDGNKLTKDVVSNVNHSQSLLYCCWHVCFTFDWLGWWLGKVIMALLSHSGLYPHHSHLQASLSFEPWLDVKAYWH